MKNFQSATPAGDKDGVPKALHQECWIIDTSYYHPGINSAKNQMASWVTKGMLTYIIDIGAFTLILTESNERHGRQQVRSLIHWIPFRRKNKYAADYVKDKRNFVSIRDGRKPHSCVSLFTSKKIKERAKAS